MSVFSQLDSLHISFIFIYNDFSVQVNLSLHACKSFQDERNDKVTAQQPLQVQEDTWGPAAWPCSSQHRGLSAASHPTGPCMAPGKYGLAVFGSLLSQRSSVFDPFGVF